MSLISFGSEAAMPKNSNYKKGNMAKRIGQRSNLQPLAGLLSMKCGSFNEPEIKMPNTKLISNMAELPFIEIINYSCSKRVTEG